MPTHSAFSRRSIRLAHYDYSEPAYYFFTLCVADHKPILGRVVDYKMECNLAGTAVREIWYALPRHFPTVELDTFVVMPNHMHGIVFLRRPVSSTGQRPAGRASPAPTNAIANTNRRGDPWVARACPPGRATPLSCDVPNPVSLGRVIGAFKSLSAAAVNRALHRSGSVWKRNYYDHIIRSTKDLDAIRAYIAQNPAQWQNDRENPRVLSPALHPFEPRSFVSRRLS